VSIRAVTGDEAADQVVADVERYRHLETIRQELVEEQEAIKARVREQLPAGKHELSTGVVTIAANRRFDPALAKQVVRTINPALLPAIMATKIDSATAKKVLPPATYEQCMKDTGTPRVSIA
jgi:hypothetical protein